MNPLCLLLPLFLAMTMPGVAQSQEFVRHWNDARGYSPFIHSLEDGITLKGSDSLPMTDSCRLATPLESFSLTFRASPDSHPWGLRITPPDGEPIWVSVDRKEVADPFSSFAALEITARHAGKSEPLAKVVVNKDIDIFNGPNIWRVATCADGYLLSAGNKGLKKIFVIPSTSKGLAAFAFMAPPGASVKIQDITLEETSAAASIRHSEWTDMALLASHLKLSKDPLEGYWALFDRTLEESLLRMGGDYKLAIVKDGPSRYLILYIDGASVNPRSWNAGDVKGILSASPFPGLFNVTWFDAEGKPLSHDIKAQSDDSGLLTIQFPYQSSTLRLRKINH